MSRRFTRRARRAWPPGPMMGVCTMALGLGGSYEARAAAPVTIEINQFQFRPREITVDAGTVVEWMNHDQTVHNIVSREGGIASPGMDTGDHFVFAFTKPGDYPYLCGLHPHMTGVIHVRAMWNPG